MRVKFLMVAALAAGVVASTAMAECVRAIPAKAERTIVPDRRINQGLLDDAVRAEVNFHRCRAGLRLLGEAEKELSVVARGHSQWMAETQMLSHRSTVPGRVSLRDRFRRSGIVFDAGAENLGMVHRYQIDNRRFQIVDADSCKFADSRGNILPPHTYASLAREVVQLWMESPGHRKNILHRQLREVSTAAAFDSRRGYCGRFWVTQNFVG